MGRPARKRLSRFLVATALLLALGVAYVSSFLYLANSGRDPYVEWCFTGDQYSSNDTMNRVCAVVYTPVGWAYEKWLLRHVESARARAFRAEMQWQIEKARRDARGCACITGCARCGRGE